MSGVYVDASAWIALLWRRDRAHGRVARAFDIRLTAGDLLVTSDAAIAETATRLRYDAGLAPALTFHATLAEAAAAGSLRIRESDPSLRRRAFRIMERYSDVPLSYADCLGAAIAGEMRADAVLGLDHGFRVLGFRLEP